MSFYLCVDSHNHHCDQDTELFHHHKGLLGATPLWSFSLTFPTSPKSPVLHVFHFVLMRILHKWKRRPFTFKIMINRLGLKSAILFLLLLFSVCFLCFSFLWVFLSPSSGLIEQILEFHFDYQ